MKKIRMFDFLRRRKLWKVYLFVKILSLFLFVFTLQLSASVNAQVAKVNVHLRNASFDDLVKVLETSTSYTFLYRDHQVADLKDLNMDYTDTDIREVLNDCLSKAGLTYVLVDNTIVIQVAPKTSPQVASITIRGVVKNEKGETLPGVTVRIKNTSVGKVTDNKGEFSFEIPQQEGIVLIFSFIGMETKEVAYTGQETLTITLVDDVEQIDDVVITGYANFDKSRFTGNYTKVTQEEILKISPRNILTALQVFEPSLRLLENNEMGSDPNTLPEIYLRGRSGMDAITELDKLNYESSTGNLSKFALQNNPNLPLFVMDGFITTLELVYDLDPHRVKSITILKDAAATAMYGAKAANGVIVIETVAPETGKLNVSYSFNGSLEVPDLKGYDLMNAKEKLEAEVLANVWNFSNAFEYTKYAELLNYVSSGVNTDWISQPLRNGFSQNHNISFTGGANEFRFSLGLTYGNTSGVMKESYRRSYSANFMLAYRVGKLEFTNTVSYSGSNNQNSPWGSFDEYYTMLPYNRIKDDDGNILATVNFPKYMNKPNPIYRTTLNNFSRDKYYNIQDNLNINWYINDDFAFRASFSIKRNSSDSRTFVDPEDPSFSKTGLTLDPREWGSLTVTGADRFGYDLNMNLSFSKKLDLHMLFLQGTVQWQEDKGNSIATRYIGFPTGELNKEGHAYKIADSKPSSNDNKTRSMGVLFMGSYSFNNIYLFDASLRFDGSSEFGAKKRWGTFWSLGAGMNLHQYDWVRSIGFVDQLRFRATYGYTGKTNFPAYASRDILSVDFLNWYSTGLGSVLMGMGNENLKWEKTAQTNIGMDLSLFKRLSFSFSWYNKYTSDLITDLVMPSSSGFKSYSDNGGENRNRGIELSVNLRLYDSKDFNVAVYANMARNEGRIMKLSEASKAYNDLVDEFFNDYDYYTGDSKYAKPFRKNEEGGSMTAIYGMKSFGINPADGKELYVDRSGNITSIWSSSEQQIIGDTEPKANGAFGFNFRYKNLSLFTAFSYKWGGQAYNATLVSIENVDLASNNADKRVLSERWKQPGDITPLKDIADTGKQTRPTSRFVQDDNELKFTSISLSYDVNQEWTKKIGIERVRLNMSTSNIATFSSIKRERGTSYPFAHSMNFGLSVNF